MRALSARDGRGLTSFELDRLLGEAGAEIDATVVRRILENQPFKRFWAPIQYQVVEPDPGRAEWRLLFALIDEIHAVARAEGAQLAILSDQDEALYEWERYWYRIAPGQQARERFLAPDDVLRKFCVERGIDFIETPHAHVRARNDPHPNREGTRNMARNVYEYVRHGYAPDSSVQKSGH